MADPFRNLRMYWHRWRKTQQMEIAGVTLATDASVPKLVRSLIFKGAYEEAEQTLLQNTIRPGDQVLEIGAGIGFIGLLSARMAGPSGQVVSYEANAALRPLIEANYARNALTPELRMRAISTDGAPVDVHVNSSMLSTSLYARDGTQSIDRIESDALQDVMKEMQPQVMVMDVEGAEVDLLQDFDLSPLRAALIELHPHIVGQDRIDALLTHLEAQGFVKKAEREKNVVLERRG